MRISLYCHVLRVCAIPTYTVYRLYDRAVMWSLKKALKSYYRLGLASRQYLSDISTPIYPVCVCVRSKCFCQSGCEFESALEILRNSSNWVAMAFRGFVVNAKMNIHFSGFSCTWCKSRQLISLSLKLYFLLSVHWLPPFWNFTHDS